jgi:beta-lactamase class A
MNNQELERRNKTLEKRWKFMLALAILFLVTRPLAVYVLNHSKHKAVEDALSNDYPLIDPARQLIPQSDYIINIQSLRDYLTTIGDQYPDQVSIYYEQLNSGANISINKNLRLFPASLTKLPLAIVVAKKVEEKEWQWDTKLTVEQSDIDSGSGGLYKTVKPGDQLSIDSLLMQLVTNSDNTAQNILLRSVQKDDLDEIITEVGLEDLFDAQGYISAKEYSRLLRVLYTSSYLERVHSQKILELMAQENFHDYLSQGIPSDVTFAHKFGENRAQGIFADSGIVYQDNHPFMITVILKGKDSSDASRQWAVGLMKQISEKSFEESRHKTSFAK